MAARQRLLIAVLLPHVRRFDQRIRAGVRLELGAGDASLARSRDHDQAEREQPRNGFERVFADPASVGAEGRNSSSCCFVFRHRTEKAPRFGGGGELHFGGCSPVLECDRVARLTAIVFENTGLIRPGTKKGRRRPPRPPSGDAARPRLSVKFSDSGLRCAAARVNPQTGDLACNGRH